MFQGHRLLIILNPASGRQAAKALAAAVEAASWAAGAARVELRSTGSVDDAGKKRRYGFVAYVAAAGRNLLGRRNRRVALTLDGRTERLAAHTLSMINAGLITVAGIEVGPPADPHDGRLDVAVFSSPNPFGAAAQVWRLLTGRPTRAELLRAGEVRLTSDRPLLVHVDGDVVGTTPLNALVHRAAVSFIADATYVRPTEVPRG